MANIFAKKNRYDLSDTSVNANGQPTVAKQHCIINENTDGEFACYAYYRVMWRTLLFYFLGLVTGGFVFLLGYWNPTVLLRLTHRVCNITEATSMLIKYKDGRMFVSTMATVEFESFEPDSVDMITNTILSRKFMRCFKHSFALYYWCPITCAFLELNDFEEKLTCKEVYMYTKDVSEAFRDSKAKLYGKNIIRVPLRPFLVLLLQTAADPFYLFQVFACVLWIVDKYIYYAYTIMGLSLLSLFVSTYQSYIYMRKLHRMVARVNNVQILRRTEIDQQLITMSSSDLVPGDVLVVPPEGLEILCDAVIISGRAIVNESSLTGESYPVTKTALNTSDTFADKLASNSEFYSTTKHKLHTLYNGTTVLQAKVEGNEAYVLAMVICTGYSTAKGRLIRGILNPKPVQFQFFRDSLFFVLILAFLAFCGFIYVLVTFIRKHETAGYTVRRSLDIITIAIPPALPFSMTIGLVYALRRLKSQQIFCIDPPRINVCGKIKLFVFDKTGTLTEDNLSVSAVLQSCDGNFSKPAHTVEDLANTEILSAMATCHSLSCIHEKLVGNPLDQYMFEFTKWALQEPGKEHIKSPSPILVATPPSSGTTNKEGMALKPLSLDILKQFQFTSTLQRMSVIVKTSSGNWLAYSKGAPEMIFMSCTPNSIPEDANSVLQKYTESGHRVLGVAVKPLQVCEDLHKLSRKDVEADMTFLGLIVFENVLKPQSKSVIDTLHDSNIRTIMATGDNLQTAVTIARECGMLLSHQKVTEVSAKGGFLYFKSMQSSELHALAEERKVSIEYSHSGFFCDFRRLPYSLALTGDTFRFIRDTHQEILPKILLSATVYARMSPVHKSLLVEDLKKLGYTVGMCGDGANDCGALNGAHAGIALSESEASIASPFTSKIFNVSCVPRLIREGRCALVTSFSSFRFMALYCMTQSIGVWILTGLGSNYSDLQFLYSDLALVLPLISTMVQSCASDMIALRRPPGRLFHPLVVIGLILHIIIQLVFQLIGYFYAQSVPYYIRPEEFPGNAERDLPFENYENAAVIPIAFFQYVWVAIVFSKGRPYRESLILNTSFVTVVLVAVLTTFFIVVHPMESVRTRLVFPIIPALRFTWIVLAIALASGIASFIAEDLLLPSKWLKSVVDAVRRKREPRNQFKREFSKLLLDNEWPPSS